MLLIVVPVVTNVFTAFIEAVSYSFTVLLDIEFSSFKSSFNFISFNITSLSHTNASGTIISSSVSVNGREKSLNGNDSGESFLLNAFNVLFVGLV